MVIRNHSVYSFPYRASYGYIILAVMVLVMSWESMKADAAIAGGVIPEESIRLRILANSDSPADQAVKRHVRDAVVADMKQFAAASAVQTIDEARAALTRRLPEIERLARGELAARGFRYDVKVELGIVPFPTKMYGSRVYPAGDYEALRITLGEGSGQNWWCVLFPPLCFVDTVRGEATAEARPAAVAAATDTQEDADQGAVRTDGEAEPAAASADGQEPEVRFFLWELLRSIAEFFRQLFR